MLVRPSATPLHTHWVFAFSSVSHPTLLVHSFGLHGVPGSGVGAGVGGGVGGDPSLLQLPESVGVPHHGLQHDGMSIGSLPLLINPFKTARISGLPA